MLYLPYISFLFILLIIFAGMHMLIILIFILYETFIFIPLTVCVLCYAFYF